MLFGFVTVFEHFKACSSCVASLVLRLSIFCRLALFELLFFLSCNVKGAAQTKAQNPPHISLHRALQILIFMVAAHRWVSLPTNDDRKEAESADLEAIKKRKAIASVACTKTVPSENLASDEKPPPAGTAMRKAVGATGPGNEDFTVVTAKAIAIRGSNKVKNANPRAGTANTKMKTADDLEALMLSKYKPGCSGVLLDLFCGSGGVGRCAEEKGCPSLSLDILDGWDLTEEALVSKLERWIEGRLGVPWPILARKAHAMLSDI